jgi:hypothetical protein
MADDSEISKIKTNETMSSRLCCARVSSSKKSKSDSAKKAPAV